MLSPALFTNYATRLLRIPSAARLADDEAGAFARFREIVDLDGAYVVEIGGCLPAELIAPSGVRRWWSCDPRFAARAEPPIETLTAAAESIPLPVKVADAAFSCNALQHVADPARVFSEVARVLRPGGVFYANFGPVWSAPDGAHIEALKYCGRILNFWDEALLPAWAHLVCDDMNELSGALTPLHGLGLAQAISNYVFASTWINRVPADAFRALAAHPEFNIAFFGTTPAFGYAFAPPPTPLKLRARLARNRVIEEARSRHPAIVDDVVSRDIEFILLRR